MLLLNLNFPSRESDGFLSEEDKKMNAFGLTLIRATLKKFPLNFPVNQSVLGQMPLY
jgi:hypothetical protein